MNKEISKRNASMHEPVGIKRRWVTKGRNFQVQLAHKDPSENLLHEAKKKKEKKKKKKCANGDGVRKIQRRYNRTARQWIKRRGAERRSFHSDKDDRRKLNIDRRASWGRLAAGYGRFCVKFEDVTAPSRIILSLTPSLLRVIHVSTAYLFSDCYSGLSQQPGAAKIEILRLVNWLYPPDGLLGNSRSLRADLIILLASQPGSRRSFSTSLSIVVSYFIAPTFVITRTLRSFFESWQVLESRTWITFLSKLEAVPSDPSRMLLLSLRCVA